VHLVSRPNLDVITRKRQIGRGIRRREGGEGGREVEIEVREQSDWTYPILQVRGGEPKGLVLRKRRQVHGKDGGRGGGHVMHVVDLLRKEEGQGGEGMASGYKIHRLVENGDSKYGTKT